MIGSCQVSGRGPAWGILGGGGGVVQGLGAGGGDFRDHENNDTHMTQYGCPLQPRGLIIHGANPNAKGIWCGLYITSMYTMT